MPAAALPLLVIMEKGDPLDEDDEAAEALSVTEIFYTVSASQITSAIGGDRECEVFPRSQCWSGRALAGAHDSARDRRQFSRTA